MKYFQRKVYDYLISVNIITILLAKSQVWIKTDLFMTIFDRN